MTTVLLCSNSLACYSWVASPECMCGTRQWANSSLVLTLVLMSFASIFLVLDPVSFDQVINLRIRPLQFVAGGFMSFSYLAAAALNGTNEWFAPIAPSLKYVCYITYIFAFFTVLALSGSYCRSFAVVRGVRRRSDTVAPSAGVARAWVGGSALLEPARSFGGVSARSFKLWVKSLGARNPRQHDRTPDAPRWGSMILYRVVLSSFTAFYLITTLFPPFEWPLAALSYAATVYHFIIVVENPGTPIWAIIHYLLHGSGFTFSLYMMIGQIHVAITTALFVPVFMRILLKLGRIVRDRNMHSACARDAFISLWTVIVPGILFFGADTYGCYFMEEYPMRLLTLLDEDDHKCGNRVVANFVAQIQLVLLTMFGLILKSDWGLQMTEATVLRLEITRPEAVMFSCVAITMGLAVKLFASREAEGNNGMIDVYLILLFSTLWMVTFTVLMCQHASIINKRRENKARRSARASILPGKKLIPISTSSESQPRVTTALSISTRQRVATALAPETLPCFWCILFLAVSIFAYLIPSVWRAIVRDRDGRGSGGVLFGSSGKGLSVFSLISHLLVTFGARSGIQGYGAHLHFLLHAAAMTAQTVVNVRGVGEADLGLFFVGVAFTIFGFFAFWYAYAQVRYELREKNPWLAASFAGKIISWLLKGGLAAAGYVYSETLACAAMPELTTFKGKTCTEDEFCEVDLDECAALRGCNNLVLITAIGCACFSTVVVSDANFTTSQILRGRSPRHVISSAVRVVLNVLKLRCAHSRPANSAVSVKPGFTMG